MFGYILIGTFKDGKGKFYIKKEACDYDSLCRTTIIEEATIFKTEEEAVYFFNKILKNCERGKEVRFSIEKIEV